MKIFRFCLFVVTCNPFRDTFLQAKIFINIISLDFLTADQSVRLITLIILCIYKRKYAFYKVVLMISWSHVPSDVCKGCSTPSLQCELDSCGCYVLGNSRVGSERVSRRLYGLPWITRGVFHHWFSGVMQSRLKNMGNKVVTYGKPYIVLSLTRSC